MPRPSRFFPARGWIHAIASGALSVLVAASPDSRAADASTFADLSIEELMNESVTSVSKRETRLADSPGAISVVTPEDIRRFGITSLPEALRLVPGMNVGRISSNQWAISARGFNNAYARKLLVLVDGRSVYTPSFGGVFWDVQDTMLEDLDRIEVIRGPGATLWGANAVNGVVNITTKSARETQGTVVTTTVGTEDRVAAAIRHGGQIADDLHYRVYLKYFDRAGARTAAGDVAADSWDALRGGFRADWQPTAADVVTFQGDLYEQHTSEQVDIPSLTAPLLRSAVTQNLNRGFNLLGRWVRTFADESGLSVQACFDRSRHSQWFTVEEREASNLEVEYHRPLGSRQVLTIGAGYRFSKDAFNNTPILSWSPPRANEDLYTAFVQDEIAIVPGRFSVTLGSKFEHNDYSGIEVQPGARFLWLPTAYQTVWAAVSRAVRTPNRTIRDARLMLSTFRPDPAGPVFATMLLPDPAPKSESQDAFELGYRIEPASNLSFDVATFFSRHRDISLTAPGAPRFETSAAGGHMVVPLEWSAAGRGHSHGAEISMNWKPVPRWQLAASYTRLDIHVDGDEVMAVANPSNQAGLRSSLSLSRRVEFNTAAYYVSSIVNQLGSVPTETPGYLRFDVGLMWRPSDHCELGVWGQNLFDGQHPEFTTYSTSQRTEFRRSVMGRLTWRF